MSAYLYSFRFKATPTSVRILGVLIAIPVVLALFLVFYSVFRRFDIVATVFFSFLILIFLFIIAAILTLRQDYTVSKGKIVAKVRVLFFSWGMTYHGTHLFLREERFFSGMNERKKVPAVRYRFYVGKKVKGENPSFEMIISDLDCELNGIPHSEKFVLMVAERFESDEVFANSVHLYTDWSPRNLWRDKFPRDSQKWTAPYGY